MILSYRKKSANIFHTGGSNAIAIVMDVCFNGGSRSFLLGQVAMLSRIVIFSYILKIIQWTKILAFKLKWVFCLANSIFIKWKWTKPNFTLFLNDIRLYYPLVLKNRKATKTQTIFETYKIIDWCYFIINLYPFVYIFLLLVLQYVLFFLCWM